MTIILLFFSSFLAATLFPFYSEVILVALIAQGESLWLLWVVATLGNTLGAIFNWMLGRYFLHFQDKRWFPFSSEKLSKSQAWFQRYGVWSLLFSWLPIVGDAFTFIAGVMRVNVITLILLSGIGKGVRYAILILFADYFSQQFL